MKHSKGRVWKGIIEAKVRAKINDILLRGRTPVAEHRPLLTLRNAQIIPPDFVEEGKKQILQNFADALHRTNIVTWTITDDHDPILHGKDGLKARCAWQGRRRAHNGKNA